MTLLEVGEDRVAQRFRGRDDERSAQARELGQALAVAQQVLDLRGEVEGQTRELAVQRAGDGQRVARPIEKIGVAERDVGRAGLDLLAHVREQDLDGHDEEAPAVDRRDGAVPAPVLAAAARLDVRHQLLPVVSLQPRVFLQRRELRAARHGEAELLQHRERPRTGRRR